jgi:hypothetical protein
MSNLTFRRVSSKLGMCIYTAYLVTQQQPLMLSGSPRKYLEEAWRPRQVGICDE